MRGRLMSTRIARSSGFGAPTRKSIIDIRHPRLNPAKPDVNNIIVRRSGVAMCRHMLLLAALLIAASGCTVNTPRSPSPNRSQYVVSRGAGFLFTPEGGVVYGMTFELTQHLDQTVYAITLFENPEKRALPLRVEATIEPGNAEFQIKSPRLTTLTNNRLYMVHLSLYWDSAHAQPLGVHQQQVLFSVPPDLKLRIEREYGVTVL
jgi:hypothetical protein